MKSHAEKKNGFIKMSELQQEYDNMNLKPTDPVKMDEDTSKDIQLIQVAIEHLIQEENDVTKRTNEFLQLEFSYESDTNFFIFHIINVFQELVHQIESFHGFGEMVHFD